MSLLDEALRGQKAADVLSNEVYQDAFAKVEAAIYAKWRESDNAADAEHLRQMGKLLRKVQNVMEGVMNTGKVADKAIEAERSKMARIKESIRSFV